MRGESEALGHHRLSVQISPEEVSVREGSTATWRGLTLQWEQYCEEKDGESLVFVGTAHDNEDEIMTVPYSHRFTDEYTAMQYAKIQDFARGAIREYDNPMMAMLTFTTSTTTSTGEPRPPLDHLDELLESWSSGVRYELDKSMNATRKKDAYPGFDDWEYLRILEPTTENGDGPSGYAHQHVAVVMDGDVSKHRFESVIDKHLDKAPNALGKAHEYDSTIELIDPDEIVNIGAYVFKYLGKTWESGDMEDYERRFAALLWESGRRRFQPSDGAQEWMSRDDDDSESGKWRFVGVGETDRVADLIEFEDYEEFRIVMGVGLREWLNGREPPDSIDRRGEVKEADGHAWLEESPGCRESTDHEFEQGRCLKCGVPVGAFIENRT